MRSRIIVGAIVWAGCSAAPPAPANGPIVAVVPSRRATADAVAGGAECREIEGSKADSLARALGELEAKLGSAIDPPERRRVLRCLAEGHVIAEAAAMRRGDEAAAAAARGHAIRRYRELADELEDGADLAEVLYYLAYEHEVDGQPERARAVYQELLDKVPSSKYCANAHLAFAEKSFSEANWREATALYAKVLAYPAAETPVWGYASYKLAYVHWNLGDYAQALERMRATISFAMASEHPNSQALAKSARRDVIPLYALGGDLAGAHAYFAPIAGDEPDNAAATLAMMRALAEHLVDTAHYADAVVLYRELIDRDADESACASIQENLDRIAQEKGASAANDAAALGAKNRARCR